MIRLVVVGEGQTEESFVRDVLAPAFQSLGIYPEPRLISTSKGNKGGALSYPRVKKFLRDTLHEDLGIVVTTFFDLYALDTGFPGYEESRMPDFRIRFGGESDDFSTSCGMFHVKHR